ncbi:histidine phosphatase family protein [Blastococcus sp. Marseille-P5729]|uniref:histidine phosphatase family protein n=1 Tax=Blastococcus sp. Marseille-P5729 TaxID=2086582 RepID=UPI000D0FFE92|nr:histidine phosphatase family protein [Blastococcus sp. Marseille-P5729]
MNDPREQQRLLSAEGEQQAANLGAAFTAHAITAGELLTSPFWRCQDAATIAFGRGEVDDQLMGLLSDDAGRRGLAAVDARSTA